MFSLVGVEGAIVKVSLFVLGEVCSYVLFVVVVVFCFGKG